MGERSAYWFAMETDAEALARLVAFEDVRTLKARYFRLMDLKEWDAWQALFRADAVMDVRDEGPHMARLGFPDVATQELLWTGASTIRDCVAGALNGIATVHHGHMGELTMRADGGIDAIWAMEDRIRYPAGSATPVAGFNGYGHYHDRYVREGEEWRIAAVVLTRLRLEPVPWPDSEEAETI